MTDTETVTLPRLSADQLVAAHAELQRRVTNVVGIVSAVARKTRRDYLPAGFESLLHRLNRRTVHPYPPKGHIQVRFERGANLEFPIELLALSDRDVATWARERIRACRHVSFHKAKKTLADTIAREERHLEAATAVLEEKRRQLANLGDAPKYEAPVRFPKPKDVPRA